MKKSVVKFLGVFALSSSLFMASCSSDDDKGNGGDTGTVEVDPNNFQGTFSGEGTTVVLDPSKVYKLNGPVKVLAST